MIEARMLHQYDIPLIMKTLSHFHNREGLEEELQNQVGLISWVVKGPDDTIGFAYGLHAVNPGVYEVWAVNTTNFSKYKIEYTRYMKSKLDFALSTGVARRIQIYTRLDKGLDKWAKALGFTKEGVHPKLGPNSEDMVSWGRV